MFCTKGHTVLPGRNRGYPAPRASPTCWPLPLALAVLALNCLSKPHRMGGPTSIISKCINPKGLKP